MSHPGTCAAGIRDPEGFSSKRLRIRRDDTLLNNRQNNVRENKESAKKEGIFMIRTGSLFSQLLSHIPRTEFAALVRKHRAERHAKGFQCWTQFVAMLFCHLARADSLREICNGLACCLGKLVHLGISKPPSKSTLAYANEHRPASLFEDLFWSALSRFRQRGELKCRKKRFRFRNKLLSLDSTTISLCLSLFPWAKFRRAKGGVKVHVLLDHDDYLPAFAVITEAKQHDVKIARKIKLNQGSIIVKDRAYNDYKLFSRWTDEGIFFVTRMKANAKYRVVRKLQIPENRNNIQADQIIRLTGLGAKAKCPHQMRRVVVWDDENEREIVLLTNMMEFGSTTIAAVYKDRWEIELFFKALKQNLKVKTFIGTTENALRIQIWTALLALLIIRWLHHLSRAGWSLSNMASLLRMNLFTYRELRDWLDDPFHTPPLEPQPEQLRLPVQRVGQPEQK
jgi:hypothetical protein